jgi:hypothetical protein
MTMTIISIPDDIRERADNLGTILAHSTIKAVAHQDKMIERARLIAKKNMRVLVFSEEMVARKDDKVFCRLIEISVKAFIDVIDIRLATLSDLKKE